MKIENGLLIGLLVLVAGALIYSMSGFFKDNGIEVKSTGKPNPVLSKTDLANQVQSAVQSESGKKTSEGEVSIDITPSQFKDGKMYFDIGVNTHTVDLSPFDFKELVTLEFDGSSIKPSSVPKLSGHHNSGTLIFNTGKEVKSFKIRIKGIPDIEERLFEWP